MIRGLFLLLTLGLAQPVIADPAATAREIAAQMEAARAALGKARGERDQLRAFAGAVTAYDRALAASWVGLDALAEAEAQAAARAEAARARMDAVTLGLLRLATVPDALRGQHPAGPEAAAQAQALLRGILPDVQAGLAEDMAALNEITTLRLLHDTARDDMAAGLAEVKAARTALLAAADERREPRRSELAFQADRMADAAGSLDALARALDGLEIAAPPVPSGALGAASLRAPVAGQVVAGFNEEDRAGVARPGLVIEAPARSLVTAPSDGLVAYAGPFLNAGDVVVLRISETALLALNGLGGLAVATGDSVAAGDPLGFLGAADTGADEILISNSQGDGAFRNEPLYIELRLDGIATDPAPYLDLGRGQER